MDRLGNGIKASPKPKKKLPKSRAKLKRKPMYSRRDDSWDS
jgi:hypothetical protein